jgi:hypothetical protein
MLHVKKCTGPKWYFLCTHLIIKPLDPSLLRIIFY